MKIGEEVIITGQSRYRNGYPINSIGYIIDIEEGDIYIVTKSLPNKRWDWFSYTSDNIKLSNSEIRNNKINQILND